MFVSKMEEQLIIYIANMFKDIRWEYRNKFRLAPKIYIKENDPSSSRYFKQFFDVMQMFKTIPEIDKEDYIRAQFEMSKSGE